MKTYCKNTTVTIDAVSIAYRDWRNGPAGKKNHDRILKEYDSVPQLLHEITNEIRNRSLVFKPIHYYEYIESTNGKKRIIGVQSVKQQICDYLAVSLLEPLLSAKVGYYQASSTKGKGQLFTSKAIFKWSQSTTYWVKLDVKQCYPSIDSAVVMSKLELFVRSEDVLYLSKTLLSTYRQGLDIGSYFSLRIAQFVLSFGYHYIESLSKTRRDKNIQLAQHQIWYMDDVLLMGNSKKDLRIATKKLEAFMSNELGLYLKPWKIGLVGEDEPIDFAGFVIRPSRVTLRSTTFLRARQAVRDFIKNPSLCGARSVCSYWGLFKHTDSRKVVIKEGLYIAVKAARNMISEHERSIRDTY